MMWSSMDYEYVTAQVEVEDWEGSHIVGMQIVCLEACHQ
jgi:hypothetical protein